MTLLLRRVPVGDSEYTLMDTIDSDFYQTITKQKKA